MIKYGLSQVIDSVVIVVFVHLWCRVEALLKRRAVEAQATAEVYLFVAEFLQLVSDSHVFQVRVTSDTQTHIGDHNT